ncbi:MAG: SAM-dependent methyltransferase, partial [Lysobacterales bacterium]
PSAPSAPSALAENRRPRPLRLDLENQRKQARSLLKAARAGDARALRRLAAVHPRIHSDSSAAAARLRWSLHHAQLVIARERGFKSWAKLKAHIEADNVSVRGALVGAVNRALETDTDQPLFVDPLARSLAGKKGRALHEELRSTTWPPYTAGPPPEQSILTRYYDDALQAAVSELSLTQVVLLGGGMDARAFRLRWPAKLVFFEVDDGAVFEHKEPVLRRRRAKPACDRRIVRANFPSAWTAKLLAAGFDARRAAAFLIPTWLVYFDAATVDRLFRELREIACAGSWLGVDFFSADTIESPFMQPFFAKLAALGYPACRFGVRHPETFLAEQGWHAECVVLGGPEASYGRWRYGYTPRSTPDRGIPRNYLAVARRMADKGKAR